MYLWYKVCDIWNVLTVSVVNHKVPLKGIEFSIERNKVMGYQGAVHNWHGVKFHCRGHVTIGIGSSDTCI